MGSDEVNLKLQENFSYLSLNCADFSINLKYVEIERLENFFIIYSSSNVNILRALFEVSGSRNRFLKEILKERGSSSPVASHLFRSSLIFRFSLIDIETKQMNPAERRPAHSPWRCSAIFMITRNMFRSKIPIDSIFSFGAISVFFFFNYTIPSYHSTRRA